MSEFSLSTPLPHSLTTAHKGLLAKLQTGIEQFKDVSHYSNTVEIRKAVERFTRELCKVPAWRAELERRSGLVAQKTAPGTAYDQEKGRALKSYRGWPKKPSRSKLAIDGLRIGEANPILLCQVVKNRDGLEAVLGDRILNLTEQAEAAFRQWLQECIAIQKECEPLECDGCWYLNHVHQAETPKPPEAANGARALIEGGSLGISALRPMELAVESIIEWIREDQTANDKSSKATGGKSNSARKKSNIKKKRGRQSDTDHKADQDIYEAWHYGAYKTYAEFARAKGITTSDVKTAIDRHRKRPSNRRNNSN